MKTPPHDFTHLWNDLPEEERKRLLPFLMEKQILHIWQVKQKAIANHKRFLAELNEWENGINRELEKYRRELNPPKGKAE